MYGSIADWHRVHSGLMHAVSFSGSLGMGRGKILTGDEREQIRSLRTKGSSVAAIAVQLGRSRAAVTRVLHAPDLSCSTGPRGRRPRLSDAQLAQMCVTVADHKGTITARELCAQLNLPLSIRRVNEILREHKQQYSESTASSPVSSAASHDEALTNTQTAVAKSVDTQVPDPLPEICNRPVPALQRTSPLAYPPPAPRDQAARPTTSSPVLPRRERLDENTNSRSTMLRVSALRGVPGSRRVLAYAEIPGSRRAFYAEVKHPELIRSQGFINGQWVDAHAKARFAVIDPSTDLEIATVADMGKQETLDAIAAATQAQRTWKKTTPHARSVLLKKWHDAIRKHADDLAVIASAECGKPLLEARGEVAYAAGFIDFYAHEVMHSGGFVVPTSFKGTQMMAVKEPIGVCGIITPWNFPLAMITRKLGPLLAAGCTAVVKPAAETPLSALALAKLAQDAGIPAGVINVIPSPSNRAADIGETLSASVDVRKLSFTGSTRVGKLLMQQSASNVKRLSLELGGNAPFIVFEDADITAAVDGLMMSKFRNTGQTCVCSNRVFLHEAIYESFTEQLIRRVKKLKIGLPREHGVQIGPLVSGVAFNKTNELVDDALAKGAQALTGGRPASTVGPNYYEPTVLIEVNDKMRVWHEEIFGPVVPLFKFKDEGEVIAKANCTEAGLAAYFYSRDLSRVWRVAGELEVGMVGVNTGIVSNVQAPFGGVKQSGLGREGSFMGMDEYVETKLICMGGLD